MKMKNINLKLKIIFEIVPKTVISVVSVMKRLVLMMLLDCEKSKDMWNKVGYVFDIGVEDYKVSDDKRIFGDFWRVSAV